MGLKSRLKMLGIDFSDRKKQALNKSHELIELHNKHIKEKYPRIEEDSEGIITWESKNKCLMKFKGITVNEGYIKTVNQFKLINRIKTVNISIEGDSVRVEF